MHVCQQFLVRVQVDNGLPRDSISAVMYSLGKLGMSWVAVLVCVVVDALGISKTDRHCVSAFVGLCVSHYKQVSLSNEKKKGRQHDMGEAVQSNNRLAAQHE